MNESWNILLKRYIDFYNQGDLISAPSQAMADVLYSKGMNVKKVIIQKMWDCVVSIDETIKPPFRRVINFAGNSNIDSKFAFVRDWKYQDVRLEVTADKEDWAQGKNLGFLGWFNNDNLLTNTLRKSGGFGLLWSEDLNWREYMKRCACYKLSTYLAAGIPVIVPSGIPEQDTIIHKNMGFVVDSLDDAVDCVARINEEEYRKMTESVEQFSYLLREGYFTKKVLTDAVFKLFNE